MNTGKYISDLLYRYQCVTVPGFGAFLTELKSAQINANSHTFFPPKKVVSFNGHLKNNDGLLANHIALQEHITYEQAVLKLKNQVNQWLYKLESRETITIEPIGEIKTNSEQQFVFTPYNTQNYLAEAFGLSNLIAPAIKRENVEKPISETVAVVEAPAQAVQEIQNNTTTSQETEMINEGDVSGVVDIQTASKKTSFVANLFKYAAILALVSGGGLYGYKYYYDQEIASQTLIVEQRVQNKLENKIQEATFFIDNPLPAVTLKIKESHIKPYHVVAGTFRNEKNASKIFSELVGLGFKPIKLEKNKHGLVSVLYGSYASMSEAQKNLKIIQANHNKDAWLMIKELK
ncbi:MAG: SPOR domain-containing protein [Flavobacterium sp.]|nr:SPOR domain-containing protein [Candidatus Neoflavobacterium equi]